MTNVAPRPAQAPACGPIQGYLEALHERLRALDGGRIATYIPELGNADPRWFAICVATIDGHVYEIGDSAQPFTLQSISKPFVYGLALEDRGKRAVLERIGVEPTGDAFNEISLERRTGRPFNPMINAGAIASSSLVLGRSPDDRWQRLLALLSDYAGRPLELDEAVYRSETATGHRNRAIAHMLRNFDILGVDVDEALDLYFRQCSIRVTCRDIAVMAATLATGGVNPLTGERAISAGHVDELLSLMTTCGMYDYAGEWLYRVGFPAKSGVAGGILAVLPGQFGIGVFSPPLDERGNSVRGVAVCEALSEDLELHFLRAPRASLATLRSRHTLRSIGSRRNRPQRLRELLAERGHCAVAYELQGDISFCGIERVSRQITRESADVELIVIDLSRVTGIDATASRFLLQWLQATRTTRRAFAFVSMQKFPRLKRLLDEARVQDPELELRNFDELDSALEWCESRLLAPALDAEPRGIETPLAAHELLEGLPESDVAILERLLERRDYAARHLIVRTGDPAREAFLLVRGEVSVLMEGTDNQMHRLATLSPGMAFGEPALYGSEATTRTAFVRADSPCTCWTLGPAALSTLQASHPQILIRLLRNALKATGRVLARTGAVTPRS
jgi:glutaminase